MGRPPKATCQEPCGAVGGPLPEQATFLAQGAGVNTLRNCTSLCTERRISGDLGIPVVQRTEDFFLISLGFPAVPAQPLLVTLNSESFLASCFHFLLFLLGMHLHPLLSLGAHTYYTALGTQDNHGCWWPLRCLSSLNLPVSLPFFPK